MGVHPRQLSNYDNFLSTQNMECTVIVNPPNKVSPNLFIFCLVKTWIVTVRIEPLHQVVSYPPRDALVPGQLDLELRGAA